MTNCNNCGDAFDAAKEGLVASSKGVVAAAVCGNCCKNVRVGKIVLRKADVGGFTYEQWSPMEMTTSGLSSKRAG